MCSFRRFVAAALVLLSAAFSAAAQDSEGEWYWNRPVAEIEFEGLKNVRKSELSGITSSFIGRDFTEDMYNDLLDRLYALDLFDEINPYAKHSSKDEQKVLLVFQVAERPVVKAVNFSGNRKIRNGELRDLVKVKTSDIFVESKVLMDERTIRDHYLQKGYTSSKVTHRTEETDGGVEVTFVITEGSNTVITGIHFSGNTVASERILKGKLQLKEAGFLKDGAFQNSTLELDRQTLVSWYRERGYVDAAVLDVRIDSSFNEAKQREELDLTFVIQEGAQYTYTGLTVSGNEVFSSERLLSLMKLQPGAVFNSVKFQEGLGAITGLYYENGYMSNEFYPTPVKDTERREISYHLTVVENVRSHIENVIIKGNSRTKDYVIRREIPLESGDVFSRDKVMNGLRNLYNLQYFSNIIPEPQGGSEPNLVDLVVSVEEQSTMSLQFGLTFSGITDPDAIPISLFGKLENSNLFGEGKSLSVSTTISNTEQSVDFTYAQNWIGNLPVAFSQSLSLSHTHAAVRRNAWLPDLSLDQYYYYMDYDGWSASLGSALSRRWTPDYAILTLAGGLTNSLTNYQYDETLYTPTDLGISLFANRWGLVNSVWTSFSVDNRDINYDPTKGWFASERLAWYGLIPGLEKEFFLKSDFKLEGYLKLLDINVTEKWALRMVLAGYTGFTAIFPATGSSVSDSNKLYVDGMFNGRGWTEAYRKPEARGQAMFSNRLELRVPIVPNIIGVDGFWDAVAVKGSAGDMFSSLELDDFYFSFGPGIRFLVPQFPLHLLFAFRYRFEDNQLKWAATPFQFVLSFNIVNR